MRRRLMRRLRRFEDEFYIIIMTCMVVYDGYDEDNEPDDRME